MKIPNINEIINTGIHINYVIAIAAPKFTSSLKSSKRNTNIKLDITLLIISGIKFPQIAS